MYGLRLSPWVMFSCWTVSVSDQPQWCGVCVHLRSSLYSSCCCGGTPLMNKPSLKAPEKLLLSGAGQKPSSVGRLQDYTLIDEEGITWRSEHFHLEDGYRFGFQITSRNSVVITLKLWEVLVFSYSPHSSTILLTFLSYTIVTGFFNFLKKIIVMLVQLNSCHYDARLLWIITIQFLQLKRAQTDRHLDICKVLDSHQCCESVLSWSWLRAVVI